MALRCRSTVAASNFHLELEQLCHVVEMWQILRRGISDAVWAPDSGFHLTADNSTAANPLLSRYATGDQTDHIFTAGQAGRHDALVRDCVRQPMRGRWFVRSWLIAFNPLSTQAKVSADRPPLRLQRNFEQPVRVEHIHSARDERELIHQRSAGAQCMASWAQLDSLHPRTERVPLSRRLLLMHSLTLLTPPLATAILPNSTPSGFHT